MKTLKLEEMMIDTKHVKRKELTKYIPSHVFKPAKSFRPQRVRNKSQAYKCSCK
jgi:hypothetical protein